MRCFSTPEKKKLFGSHEFWRLMNSDKIFSLMMILSKYAASCQHLGMLQIKKFKIKQTTKRQRGIETLPQGTCSLNPQWSVWVWGRVLMPGSDNMVGEDRPHLSFGDCWQGHPSFPFYPSATLRWRNLTKLCIHTGVHLWLRATLQGMASESCPVEGAGMSCL